jgi:ABC-2 type transport system ATP-binding protein
VANLAAVIEAFELTRKFKDVTAVDHLSLSLSEGEVLGFLGPNGAGKTTTIRMLAGIMSPTSGYAVVAGNRTDGDIQKLHQVIGLLTETPGFYDNLSARRNLEYYAGFYADINVRGQVERYLRIMGLWERREGKVGTYSKGMKQKLALARALIHEPKVLLLDEPTSGLDPESAHEVRDIIKGLGGEGRTIFLSTHNLAEAEALCRRIAVVKTRLLAVDSAENLRRRLFKRRIIIKLASVTGDLLDRVSKLPYVRSIEPADNELRLEVADPDADRPRLIESVIDAGGRVMTVTEEEHSLEDIYLNLVHGDNDDT